MCTSITTLAIEAAAVVDGLGRPSDAKTMNALVASYSGEARGDAERATSHERSARDRVMSLNERLQAAKRSGEAVREGGLASQLAEARTEMESSAAAGALAVADYTFAERCLRRAEREKARAWPLAGAAIRGFAVERLRQIEEIVSTWGAPRPSRDVSFVAGLRVVFNLLRNA